MLQLLILGFLYNGDRHPYEVMQVMKERKMETYIKLNYGTLYYSFEQLLKRGDIEVKEIVHEDKRPDKTIYRITAQGRERFLELLHRQFTDVPTFYHPIYPALMFARFGDPEIIGTSLRNLRARFAQHLDGLRATLNAKQEQGVHWASLQIMKNSVLHGDLEIAWIDEFLRELEEKGL